MDGAKATRGSGATRFGGMEPEAVRVWLLGGFRVSVGSLTLEENGWRRRKAKTLIKLLALAQGHRLHRGWISALLWPGLDAKSQTNNFHRVLHFARKALGDDPGAYRLHTIREGVREQPGRPLTDTLADNPRTKDLPLVLDNCEHLVDSVARLANALLAVCPELRILATSREPLGVSGEAIWPAPPLSLPDVASSAEGLMRSEAVRLFVDRARSRLPDFELSEENAGAVAMVCRKLDGIPLAIELATARMGALARADSRAAGGFPQAADRRKPYGRTPAPDNAGNASMELRVARR